MLNLDIVNYIFDQIDYITSSYGFPIANLRRLIFTKFWIIPYKEAHFSNFSNFLFILEAKQ